MRTLITLTFFVCMLTAAVADDTLEMRLGAKWERTNVPRPTANGWTWHTWQHRERADLLTIACNPMKRDLTSYGDLDRAMDFASSAYPVWLNSDDFPSEESWSRFGQQFLKLKTDSIRATDTTGKTERVPIISYVMVNDDDTRSFMANGFVVCVADNTYYIQHNSKRPISDATARDALRQLLKQLDR